MITLINSVDVNQDKSLTIIYNFQDEFERLKGYVLDNSSYLGAIANV